MIRTAALCSLLALPALAAEPKPVVDRGLPQINLNMQSGDARSNIRWSWYDHGFIGDDFTFGQPGEHWVIDAIRTWTVPDSQSIGPARLGDLYQDVRLYFGSPDSSLTPRCSHTRWTTPTNAVALGTGGECKFYILREFSPAWFRLGDDPQQRD